MALTRSASLDQRERSFVVDSVSNVRHKLSRGKLTAVFLSWRVPLQVATLAACADVSFIGYVFVRAGLPIGPGGVTGLNNVLAVLVENAELSILLAFALLFSGICSFAAARWRTIVGERRRPLVQDGIFRLIFRWQRP